MICLICMASALMPVAVRIWAYMSSKSFMSVLQLLHITTYIVPDKQTDMAFCIHECYMFTLCTKLHMYVSLSLLCY